MKTLKIIKDDMLGSLAVQSVYDSLVGEFDMPQE